MPQGKAIKRIVDGYWCKQAGDSVAASVFTNDPEEVQIFPTQAAANDQITAWGETPGTNFVGQNPPPR